MIASSYIRNENKKINKSIAYITNVLKLIPTRKRSIRVIGMITFSSLLATAIGVIGSLVQARFISPEDLGFIRKYSVISGYAVFLSLGLFTILQREYPVLMGQGKPEQARRTVALVQSWCLLSGAVVCSGLLVATIAEVFQSHWREAAAWFVQLISVWATLYVGYLTCTFRSGQEFEREAKGNILSSIFGIVILPLFWLWPFMALVLRSVTGQIVSFTYLHIFRPVKVGWYLSWKEFWILVKRGMRLFVGTYLRYSFWVTVEIWLMLQIAGDAGVGLLVFSKLIAESITQLSIAINQVYFPRIAHLYGTTGSINSCLRFSLKPTFINLLATLFFAILSWGILPFIITLAFPKYVGAIPILRILLFQGLIGSLSIPIYMVTVLEDYRTQLIGAAIGLLIFIGVSFGLRSLGFNGTSVAWGSLAGQTAFALTSLFSLQIRAKDEIKSSL